MAGWGGFSEADLHRLKKDQLKSDGLQMTEEKPEKNIRKANINTGTKRQRPREKIKSKVSAPKNTINSRQETVVDKSTIDTSPELNSKHSLATGQGNDMTREKTPVVPQNGPNNEDEEEKVPDIIDEPERIQAIELTALQKMQQKQSEMEDQNKKKKAALQETIRTRFRKTQAEASTLKSVHQELAHLDNLLSADVSVLRDTIEEASIDYHYAMKRYEQAEAEFVSAKVDLHKKTERKEMFTQHLLTIIQQNEERKAEKLEELMAKLELSEELIVEQNAAHHESTGNSIKENGNEMGDTKQEMDKKKINIEKADEDENVTESGTKDQQEKSEMNGNSELKEERQQNKGTEDHNGKVVTNNGPTP